jgi:hypothetical protein
MSSPFVGLDVHRLRLRAIVKLIADEFRALVRSKG